VTLTEADLAHKIADDSGFMKGGGGRDRDRLFEVIEASLVSSEVVMVSGFGRMERQVETA
jgi:nucleoid DNA-binding protein